MLLLMLVAFVDTISNRTPFKLDIERDRGALYQITVNDTITNAYTLKLINMSQTAKTYHLSLNGIEGMKMDAPTTHYLRVNELKEVLLTIEIDPQKVSVADSRTDIEFIVTDADSGEEVAREESRFIAPRS